MMRPVLEDWRAVAVVVILTLIGFNVVNSVIAYLTAPSGPAAVFEPIEIVTRTVRVGEGLRYHLRGQRLRYDCSGFGPVSLHNGGGLRVNVGWRNATVTDLEAIDEEHIVQVSPATPSGRYQMVITMAYICRGDDIQSIKATSDWINVLPSLNLRYPDR